MNNFAFAARLSNGRVITWGEAGKGGNSRDVAAELTSVVHLEGTTADFAALRSDGRVVCWGATADLTETVLDTKQLIANNSAFAALRDGRVACWGLRTSGGYIPTEIAEQLVDVQSLHAGRDSFIATRKDGTAVVWGEFQLDPMAAELAEFRDILEVASTGSAMALLRSDGRVLLLGSLESEGATELEENYG